MSKGECILGDTIGLSIAAIVPPVFSTRHLAIDMGLGGLVEMCVASEIRKLGLCNSRSAEGKSLTQLTMRQSAGYSALD